MSYLAIKHLHVTCVVLSGIGFALRGSWMLAGSSLLVRPWVKVAPHLVDSVLLGSAIALAVMSGQYPFVQPWLTAKLFGLLAYIVLGTLALKRGRTRAGRVVCFILALVVFAYIVGVAVTRSPWPFGQV